MEKLSGYSKENGIVTQEYIDGGLKTVKIENFDANMMISWGKNVTSYRSP